MGFDRGFKKWAETSAINIRRELDIAAHEPLSPNNLADYLGAEMLSPEKINGLPPKCLHQLLQIDPDGWSAVTVQLHDRALIIFNPNHSPRRQASDKMHELAHLLIGHEPAKIILSQDGTMIMRSYDQKQEDEAIWLSGCLLLPREALLYISRKPLDTSVACKWYCVSEQLLTFRMNLSGVNLQMKRIRAR